MPDEAADRQHIAIACEDVGKSYVLYPSPRAMALDRLGIYDLFPSRRPQFPTHRALSGVNITIEKGEKVALIGRNGAGKSTLLKLLTGLSRPTEGNIRVSGQIQALFDLGLGFHPEFSGRENILSALAYNGLAKSAERAAIDDIVEFCELGGYLDQPVSTYSSGMRARLFFAVATAIIPDVLIVDEVLSVGDAYFSARAAQRVRNLTAGGCTLLLVSHSSAQVLQFCDRAIWIDQGRVRADGPALEVVKSYEAYIRRLRHGDGTKLSELSDERNRWLQQEVLEKVTGRGLKVAEGGVNRWIADGRLAIEEVHADSKDGGALISGDKLTLTMRVAAGKAVDELMVFCFFFFGIDGALVSRFVSNPTRVKHDAEEAFSVKLELDPFYLGAGEYILSAEIFEAPVEDGQVVNEPIDTLSRSFLVTVVADNPAEVGFLVLHPHKWSIQSEAAISLAKS